MDEQIKKVLLQIENAGYEAYVIGGYVRDFILGRFSIDVDICTNALPKDLSIIFDMPVSKDVQYGSFKFRTSKYNFDITTFRHEDSYQNRRPTEVIYINNLEEDILRRDFTINSLCMNKNGKIIDILNAQSDIYSKEIKVIGDVKKKMTEDPLRILRAVRFATVLDFKLERELSLFIKDNCELVKELSFNRKKEEISLVLQSTNALKGLKLIKDLGLCKSLEIDYNRIKYISDLSGMWAQLEYSDKYPFTKQESNNIKDLRTIIIGKKINNEVLYKYDLYISMVAGNILGINNKRINELYKNLPIYNSSDIQYTFKDISELHPTINKKCCREILKELEMLILSNKLKNNHDIIDKYISTNEWRWTHEK